MSDTSQLPDPLYALVDPTGTFIDGLFANPQPGIPGVVQIELNDPMVIAFLNKPPVTISPFDMMNRFTSAEQEAIMTSVQTSWKMMLWLTQFNTARQIVTTDSATITGFTALVNANLITQDRMNQILDLSQTSP